MTERHERMLRALADYEQRDPTVSERHNLVWMPLGTRLLRMIRISGGWQLWLATADYVYGTYLFVHDNGRIERVTSRTDEGDEIICVRPSDEEIRSKSVD